MAHDTTPLRNDALLRASLLANRARALRRAQSEVRELTTREVQVLARTAASFFDSIPLVEFTNTSLPQSARGLRRIRHRVLHRTVHHGETGTLIRALLLGRDGVLRLFSARSADSRDLLLILEPGRTLPVGVIRDVVDWTPTLRVPEFRPFEILDRLSHSLDAVEDQIGVAELRVRVQKAALVSGDLSALLPATMHATARVSAVTAQRVLAATAAAASAGVDERDPFDIFDRVEAVANAAHASADAVVGAASAVSAVGSVVPVSTHDAEPDEWDEAVAPPARKSQSSSNAAQSLVPALPSPR